MIQVDKIYKNVKDNISIIILLPTILGGLWQLIELSSLSFSFVRFFSVTQLLPDGLLILTMIILLYIAYYLGISKYKFKYTRKILALKVKKTKNFNFIKNIKSQKLIYVDNPIYRKENIFLELLIIVFTPILFYLFFKFTNIYDELTKDFNFIIFVIAFYFIILFFNLFLSSLFILIVHFLESKAFSKIKNKPLIKEFLLLLIKMLMLILIILVILFPMKLAFFFHEKYLLPKNLKNLEYLDKTLKNKNYQSSKIVYLNDKYIFIEHKINEIISIEIVKFDDLFEKDTYKVTIEKE